MMRCIDCENCTNLYCSVFKLRFTLTQAMNPCACLAFIDQNYQRTYYSNGVESKRKDY